MGETTVYFNTVFQEANETKRRYRVMKGSAGSGKSVNVAQDFILKLSDKKYQGASLMCVRKVGEANALSTYPELKGAIKRIFGDSWESHWKCTKQPLAMKCLDTGNQILFMGMKDSDQTEKMKSVTVEEGSICWAWVEEATEIGVDDFDTLDDRLRGELDNPNLYYQVTMTFNPVSADHWIKARFFDCPADDVFTHHSTYLTNEFIDPAYKERMERGKKDNPEHYKVYGLGEWGLTGGQFFSEWSEKKHVCKPFPIPEGWTRMRVMDWGSSRPYAVYWLAVDFDGRIYVYRELYGYGGKPNVGSKESAFEVAVNIAGAERGKDSRLIYQAILDNACWTRQDVGYPSIAETINNYLTSQGCTAFVPSVKGRAQCAEQMHLRLKGDGESPQIIFFANCYHAIRTIPLLTHDRAKPEMPNTNGEDHAYDAIAYGLMARPYVPEQPREKDAYADYDFDEEWEDEGSAWGV